MAQKNQSSHQLGKKDPQNPWLHRQNPWTQLPEYQGPRNRPRQTHSCKSPPSRLHQGKTCLSQWNLCQLHQRKAWPYNQQVQENQWKIYTHLSIQSLHCHRTCQRCEDWRSYLTRKVSRILFCILWRSNQLASPFTTLWSPHWPQWILHSKSGKSLPSHSKGTKSYRRLPWRKPQIWKNQTFQFPSSLILLLHWKKRWPQHPQTMPRL